MTAHADLIYVMILMATKYILDKLGFSLIISYSLYFNDLLYSYLLDYSSCFLDFLRLSNY